MWKTLFNYENFPFLKDVIIIFLKTFIIMIPCVIGSLIRSVLFTAKRKERLKLYIIYAIVPSFVLAGIISKFIPFDSLLGLSAVIGLVARDLTEGASNISGLLKTYNMVVKVIRAVKNVEEVEFQEDDIPTINSTIENNNEPTEITDNESTKSEETISFKQGDGELFIENEETNTS